MVNLPLWNQPFPLWNQPCRSPSRIHSRAPLTLSFTGRPTSGCGTSPTISWTPSASGAPTCCSGSGCEVRAETPGLLRRQWL